MQCPVDGETLVMTQRSGVEIDYCPKCRGVWLDRGELDKIVDRAGADIAQAARVADPGPRDAFGGDRFPADHRPDPRGYPDDRRDARPPEPWRGDDRYRDDRPRDDYRPRKRRESFLSDIFDFS
ncbi:zf-TFIIB domain-containing protein [uncultured Paracoccus sp.]|uniref:TFIIB-type zinc ribbon-containing protein n=1 Tax=uncultured Paracoccus sp. TaxID=189685 RepID=UPI0026136DCD|nr:zf-TFIIB domain-containing protein [uncultured Paracoccus sp.]